MDTRLKNFKYSWFTKALCILLACAFAVSGVMSFIPMFYRFIITNGKMNFSEDVTIYETTSFVNYVRSDINVIIGLSRQNEFEQLYQTEKQKCIESIVEQFKAEKKPKVLNIIIMRATRKKFLTHQKLSITTVRHSER